MPKPPSQAIVIERVIHIPRDALFGCDLSYDLDVAVTGPFGAGGALTFGVGPGGTKAYATDITLTEAAGYPDQLIASARVEGRFAGYIRASHAWNNCAQIEDLAVVRGHRGVGLGRALMDEAVRWANEKTLPLLRLETQASNAGACRFYQAYGFSLGGYDRHLYDALGADVRGDVALFWYLPLDMAGSSGRQTS